MWFFKPKSKKIIKLPPLGTVGFGPLEYKPCKDITAYEVALLIPIFATARMPVDKNEYIIKHNLSRHFIDNSN